MIKYSNEQLSKVTLSGGCRQSNLPEGYQEVEYLESSGTLYIDLGVKVTHNLILDIKYQYTQGIVYGRVIGDISSENGFAISCANVIPTSSIQVNWGRSWTPQDGVLPVPNYDIAEVHIENAYVTATVNSSTATASLNLGYSFETENNIILFGASGRYMRGRIYYCKIDSTRNLIPARRLSDSVLGMYDTVTNTFLTNQGTGSFTAGPNVVNPTPDRPVDIWCNNGRLKLSPNLLKIDENTPWDSFSAGKYVALQVPNGTYTCSTSVPATNTQVSNAWFDDNTNFSSSTNPVSLSNSRTINVTNGILYFAVRTENGYFAGVQDGTYWVQIEKGSTATLYHPYGIYADDETEVVGGVNLYDASTRITGYYINESGQITEGSNTNCYSGLIPVFSNLSYIIKYSKTYTGSAGFRVHEYDSNGNWIRQSGSLIETQIGNYKIHIMTLSSTSYLRISLTISDTNVQVREAATASNLLSVGNYKDLQEVIGGSITRKVGVKVLDGTENWAVVGSQFPYFRCSLLSSEIPQSGINIQTHFETKVINQDSNNIGLYVVYSTNTQTTNISVRDGIHSTNEGVVPFKQWLADQYAAGTPVIVVYPLATETTESVTPQTLTKAPITQISGSISNLPITIDYQAKNLLKRFITQGFDYPVSPYGTEEIVDSDISPVLSIDYGNSVQENQEFVFRPTKGSLDTGIGKVAKLVDIKGSSCAWNQLCTAPRLTTNNSTYFTVTNDRTLMTCVTPSNMRTTLYVDLVLSHITFTDGYAPHKYFVRFTLTPDVNLRLEWSTLGYTPERNNYQVYNLVANKKNIVSRISDTIYRYQWFGLLDAAAGDTCTFNSFEVIDLALLGIDNLTTVAQIEEWLATHVGLKDYYPYNAGEILNVDMSGIKTTGFNQWDEEWEVGLYTSAGIKMEYNTAIRCKNAISVFPNTAYYINQNLKTGNGLFFYDANGTLISRSQGTIQNFITPLNCYKIRFDIDDSYGTTYNHDICINLSNPSKNGTYEPYKGYTKSLDVTAIKGSIGTGFNIWDEEWEAGNITSTTGENSSSTTLIRTKNYIQVKPGGSYYIRCGLFPTAGLYARFYGINKNYLTFTELGISDVAYKNVILTIPQQVYYVRFVWTATTYNNDICINVSDPNRNGEYEPHFELITIFPDGMKSAGSVRDEIVKVDGVWKAIKRVGSVDMGDLEWVRDSSDGTYFFRAPIANMKSTGGDAQQRVKGLLSSMYPCDTVLAINNTSTNKTIRKYDRPNGVFLYVRDDSYSDATTFTTTMSGVMLNYELAEPQTYVIDPEVKEVEKVYVGSDLVWQKVSE